MNSPQELSRLIQALRTLQRQQFQPGAALATIIRTRGSTFRRTGTSMLVMADGAVICALAGGCPQRDIVQRALDVIACNAAQIVAYNQESGLDVLMEMGCGGELEVLIEPVLHDADLVHLQALEQCLAERQPAWMATVFAGDGGTALRPRRAVWDAHSVLFDGISDASLLDSIRRQRAPHGHRPAVSRLPSEQGDVEVLLERLVPPLTLLIIGAGAGAQALAPLAQGLGWQVTLVDQDTERLQAQADSVERVLCASPNALPRHFHADRDTAVVVMTHNLEQDIAYLRALQDRPLGYLGVLGSRERVELILSAITPSMDHLYAPAGLDIGSETPQEIALAIAAEILAVHNTRSGQRLRDSDGPIH